MPTIKLSSPIKGMHGESVSSVMMREPRYRDYMDLGSPVVWMQLPGGGGYEQETEGVTRAWIERLCDIDPNLLEQLSLADTLELRNQVMRFFREARERRDAMTYTDSPAPLSSDSNGPSGPSKI